MLLYHSAKAENKIYYIDTKPVLLYGTKYWVIKRYYAHKISILEMSIFCWMCVNTS